MRFIESLRVDLRRGLNTGTHPFGSHALWDQAKSLGDWASGSRDSRDGISYLTGAALLAVIAPAEIITFILGASRYGSARFRSQCATCPVIQVAHTIGDIRRISKKRKLKLRMAIIAIY